MKLAIWKILINTYERKLTANRNEYKPVTLNKQKTRFFSGTIKILRMKLSLKEKHKQMSQIKLEIV